MAAAAATRDRGRASAPRLLLLLLVPLLWASAGVRAVPDEDLRNKEPLAPVQQLQPQPAAAQVPEPARAEVSRTGRGGRGCGARCAGYQALGRPRAPPSFLGCRRGCGGGGEPGPARLLEMKDRGGRFFQGQARSRLAPSL